MKQSLLLIGILAFLVSCGSESSSESPELFNFFIDAPNEAYDYSIIEIKANSSSSISSLQLISDDLTLISSNNNTNIKDKAATIRFCINAIKKGRSN